VLTLFFFRVPVPKEVWSRVDITRRLWKAAEGFGQPTP
jgi:hypothetical protein